MTNGTVVSVIWLVGNNDRCIKTQTNADLKHWSWDL